MHLLPLPFRCRSAFPLPRPLFAALFVTLLVFALSAPVQAQTQILLYDFENFSVNSSISTPGISATPMSVGAGTNSSFFVSQGNPGGHYFLKADETEGGDLAGAIANNEYFRFSVTAFYPGELDLYSLSFDTWTGTVTNAGYALRSSLDGYAANIGDVIAHTPAMGWTSHSIDLTSGTFQNVTSSVEFRLYAWDDGSANTIGASIDNVALSVSAVPEPAAVALTAGILALLIAARHRHRQATASPPIS